MDPGPYSISPHDRQRRPVHRGVWRIAGAGIRRDPGRHDLHRDPAGRRQCLGADGRSRAAEFAAGGADLGGRPRGAHVQRPHDEPLDRAARRHQHDVYRIPPCQRNRRRNARRGGPIAISCCRASSPPTSYEEGQRHPGDYEAQVSQRPIAIHGSGASRRHRPRGQHVPPPDSGAASGPSKPATTQPVCAATPAR